MQEISHDSKIVRAMQTDVDWTTEPRFGTCSQDVFPPADRHFDTQRFHVGFRASIVHSPFKALHSNIDAKETQRIKEIRGSPHFAYYGSEYSWLRNITRGRRNDFLFTGVDLFTKVYGPFLLFLTFSSPLLINWQATIKFGMAAS